METFCQFIVDGNLLMHSPPTKEKFHSKHSSSKGKAVAGSHHSGELASVEGLKIICVSEPASYMTHDMAEAELAAKPRPHQMSPP